MSPRENAKLKVRQAESAYTWPGGYPVFAVMGDADVMCPKCVKENRGTIYHNTRMFLTQNLDRHRADKWWTILSVEINWEDTDLYCDECNSTIESAYGNAETAKDMIQ